jgi:hypothetical protein
LPVARPWGRSRVGRRRCWRDQHAFSLIETLLVCARLPTLASRSAAIYVSALKTARITRAIGDLHALGAFLGLAADF